MKRFLVGLLAVLTLWTGYGGEVSASNIDPEKRMFTITGYYSPLPDQDYYVTGDYWSEIRLNGEGKFGADGTPVYPGMIAAPPNYSFGTQICITGLLCGAVHDRGQAIVEKGVRDLAKHTRLDIWMGYGEEGLRRALALGVKHVEGQVYPSGSYIKEWANFSVPPQLFDLIDVPSRVAFNENLGLGSYGEAVEELQEYLYILGFFTAELTGTYGEQTEKAVYDFQSKYFLIDDWSTPGAGRFGPQTREELSNVLFDKAVQEKLKERWDEFHFNDDMRRGVRSGDVWKLQEMLVKEEMLLVPATGFFGPMTEAALKEFQIKYGIIVSENDRGAGNMGPKTREKLNELLATRKDYISHEKKLIFDYKKEWRQKVELVWKK